MIFTQGFFSIGRSLFLTPDKMMRESMVLLELYMSIGTENTISSSMIWGKEDGDRKEQRNEHQRERRGLRIS